MSVELCPGRKASEVSVAATKPSEQPPQQFLPKMLATEMSLEEISAQLLEEYVPLREA